MTDKPFDSSLGFLGLTGIELVEANVDYCSARLEVADHHHQPYGVVHGGVYSSLAETVASTGAALWAIENGHAGVVGVNNTTDFLRATTDGVLLAEATPIHRGRSQQLWQVDVSRDTDGRLVARSQVRLQNIEDTSFG